MNRSLSVAAFVAGAVAIAWVATTTLTASPLALAVTALIAAGYAAGALELRRFQAATDALEQALADVPESMEQLSEWLQRVPPGLRDAVRLRIEGERVALPGPALTPYLVGLLVMLGMLGTFLGMVVTLGGTSVALERASDLSTMRETLAAPVKGLGLAFGTSVAGVAASAALGLMSALARRARQQTTARLDARRDGPLRRFHRDHLRQASFELQQAQARLLPELVAQLQRLAEQLDARSRDTQAQLLDGQQRLHERSQAATRELATAVEQSLRHSLDAVTQVHTQSMAASARLAADSLQPAVQAAIDGIAREAAALHGRVADTLQQQLDAQSSRFDASTAAAVQAWQAAQRQHEAAAQAQATQMQASLAAWTEAFEQRSTAWIDAAAQRLDDQARQLDAGSRSIAETWAAMLARQDQGQQAAMQRLEAALEGFARSFEQRSCDMLADVTRVQSQAAAQTVEVLAARDEQRLEAWRDGLASWTASLRDEWQRTGERTLEQQQRLSAAMEATAARIAAQSEAHAQATIAEIARLAETASQAPRAAAELVAQLREKLSDSLARDQAVLEERTRVMATLHTLLDAVQQAGAAQKAAIDELVDSAATGLAQATARLVEQSAAQTTALESVAAQLGAGAADVASLGEAFAAAVQHFAQSGEQLGAHLQRVEEALSRSMARSDEQLAYYVAQAREVIDLSLASQQRVVEDLQRLAATRGHEDAPA